MVSFKKKPKSSSSTLFGFTERARSSRGEWKLQFKWRRIFIAIAILGVIGWIALFSTAYFYIKHKHHYDELSYWKTMVIPFRYSIHKKELGDYLIKKGLSYFEEKEYSRALFYFRTGLSKSPHNTKGRLHLAQYYMPGRLDIAIELLEHDLENGLKDIDYITLYFKTLMQMQEDSKIIIKTDELLPKTDNQRIKRALAIIASYSYYFRGQYDDAESMINKYDLKSTLEGHTLSANIDWQRDQKMLAIKKLEASLDKGPSVQVYTNLTSYYRELKDHDRARKYAILNSAFKPKNITPRIDLLYIFNETNEIERKNKEIEQIIKQYGHEANALTQLASFASRTNDIDLVIRIYDIADKKGFGMGPFAITCFEAYIRAGKFQKAIDFADDALRQSPRPTWLDTSSGLFNGLRALAYYSVGNQSLCDVHIKQFIEDRNIRVESMLAMSKLYEDAGAMQESRSILNVTYKNNINNQAALTNLIRLDLLLGNSSNLSKNISKLLKMRRPSKEVLTQAYKALGSDRFIFTNNREDLLLELDELIK